MARKRNNFTKTTKRAARERSDGLCEAIGEWYGHAPGVRCNAPLSGGVEFDHIDLDANSKDASLENCAAVCIPCHDFKTNKHDKPKAAKTQRQQDKARGIDKPAQSIKSRGFAKSDTPARNPKDPLPPRRLYQ